MRYAKKLACSAFVLLWSVSSHAADAWPVGYADSAEAAKNTSISIDVLDNDTGGELTLKSVNESSVGWGRITINEDKTSLTYTPYSDFTGTDEFWYVLEDEYGRTNAAKVTVVVNDNGWPQAVTDTASAAYGEEVTLSVLDNDVGTGLRLVSTNEWSADQGKVSIDGNRINYQQVGEPRGEITDEFWYVFEDQWGRKNAAKVVVSLSEGTSTAWPVANADAAEAQDGLRAMIPVLDNDTGEGLTITKSNEWTANGGKTEIVQDLIRYTPPRNFTGTDHFWYDFEDKFGRANSAKVTVDVTQNTATSIVAFCGVNYETDGTAANTVVTSQEPVVQAPKYAALDKTSLDAADGVFGDRRYYFEGAEETGLSLWVEIGGNQKKLVGADAGEPLYLVGAYNQTIYFAKGLDLFAHNGQTVTDLGYLFKGIADLTSDTEKYIISSQAVNNALYFSALTLDFSVLTAKTNKSRVSDGLDLNLLDSGTVIDSQGDVLTAGTTELNQTTETQLTYFNGFDYSKQWRYNYWNRGTNEGSIVRTDLGELQERIVVDSSLWDSTNIVENNNRLFVTQGNEEAGAKLYTVDLFDHQFVELASCDAN